MRTKFLGLLVAVVVSILLTSSGHAQQIDPRINIKWPLLSGNGDPTTLGIPCSSTNYTQPFQDTSQNPNVYHMCGSHGWQTLTGATGPVGPAGSISNWTGGANGGNLSASVNTQINVMAYPYNCVGDGVTDDTACFNAAQAAALAYAVGDSLPAALYLPKPPVCYLIDHWGWEGVPLEGQPMGLGPASPQQYGVTICGKPGHDIIHIPDPTTTSGTIKVYAGWSIRNIGFSLNTSAPFDTTVGYTNAHRWPGRWFDDGAMTNGSTQFTSTSANITCGDGPFNGNAGQAIVVGGAGATVTTTTLAAAITSTSQTSITISGTTSGSWPVTFGYLQIDSEIVMYVGTQANGISTLTVMRGQAGTTAATHSNGATVTVMGNLTTTIASVSPCWQTSSTSWQVVTLAASASTTISHAHSYISVLGLSATTNIGNCAIAQDMMDGNSNDWTGTANIGDYGKLENVVINGGGATGNTACGIYTQALGILYGLDAKNIGLYSLWAGAVQNSAELNSGLQSSSGDFERWEHVAFLFGWTPYIDTNGLAQQLLHWEVTSRAGMQILTLSNVEGDYPVGWHIDHGMECPYSTACIYGDHITGSDDDLTVSLTSGAATQYGFLDTSASKCWNCALANVYVDGYRNEAHNAGSGSSTSTVNQGLGNIITTGYSASPFSGIPPNYEYSITPYKGSNSIAGRYTSDFIQDGNPSTPYNHDDLFIWPTDLEFNSSFGWANVVVTDSTSPTGYHIVLTNNTTYTTFNQVGGRTGAASMIVGSTVPTTGGTLYMMVMCPSGTTTFQPQLATVGGASYSQPTFNTCSSTQWQTYAVNITWQSGDVGKTVKIGAALGSNTFYVAWMDFVPFPAPVQYAAAANQVPLSCVLQAAGIGIAEPGTFAYNCDIPVAGSGAGLTSGPTSGTTANHVATFTGTNGQIQDSGVSLPSSASTGSIGGSSLAAGACASGTASISGAANTGVATASPQTYPGDGFTWEAYISSSGTVTVKVCAIVAGTPTASLYEVRYQP